MAPEKYTQECQTLDTHNQGVGRHVGMRDDVDMPKTPSVHTQSLQSPKRCGSEPFEVAYRGPRASFFPFSSSSKYKTGTITGHENQVCFRSCMIL